MQRQATVGNVEETVIIVDDNEDFALMLGEQLDSSGFKIFYANSAKEALETIAQHEIDVVLSD